LQARILIPVDSFLEDADGLILTTSKTYDSSGSLKAMQDYRLETKKATFAIGPILPLQYGSGQISNRGDDAVASFLADKLQKFGEKSVLFVSISLILSVDYWTHSKMSFGTVVWPDSLDYVEEVIECMIEKKLPFVSSLNESSSPCLMFILTDILLRRPSCWGAW
jgi:hypothetical protein